MTGVWGACEAGMIFVTCVVAKSTAIRSQSRHASMPLVEDPLPSRTGRFEEERVGGNGHSRAGSERGARGPWFVRPRRRSGASFRAERCGTSGGHTRCGNPPRLGLSGASRQGGMAGSSQAPVDPLGRCRGRLPALSGAGRERGHGNELPWSLRPPDGGVRARPDYRLHEALPRDLVASVGKALAPPSDGYGSGKGGAGRRRRQHRAHHRPALCRRGDARFGSGEKRACHRS